jgi:hypothetical protein
MFLLLIGGADMRVSNRVGIDQEPLPSQDITIPCKFSILCPVDPVLPTGEKVRFQRVQSEVNPSCDFRQRKGGLGQLEKVGSVKEASLRMRAACSTANIQCTQFHDLSCADDMSVSAGQYDSSLLVDGYRDLWQYDRPGWTRGGPAITIVFRLTIMSCTIPNM